MAEGEHQITKRRRLDSDGIVVEKNAEETKSPSPAAEEVAENIVQPVAEEVAENNVGAGGNEEADIFDWLNTKTMEELWEIISALPELNCKVKFIDDPYVPPVIVQSSSAYVTINGNEESCGSSFSESESVMASIDRCSGRSTVIEGGDGAWSSEEVKAMYDDMERFLFGPDGCDSSEFGIDKYDAEDEWVKCVREFLSGGSK